MDDDRDDAVVDRLRAAGRQPVSPGLERDVVRRAHGPAGWFRSTRAKVAAASAAGFLVGSVGFASAGTLPAPVQEVAHDALGAVGISVPPGHDRYNGPECGGTYKNHGQYVKAHKGDPNASASPCGKPIKSLKSSTKPKTGSDADEVGDADEAGTDADGRGNGKGKGKDKGTNKDKGDKVRDQGDEDEQGEEESDGDADDEDEAEASTSAPTTTVAPPVTTAPATTAPPATVPVGTTTSTAATTTSTTASTTTSTTAAPPGTTTEP